MYSWREWGDFLLDVEILALVLAGRLLGKGESSPFSLSRLSRELRGGTRQKIGLQERPSYPLHGFICLRRLCRAIGCSKYRLSSCLALLFLFPIGSVSGERRNFFLSGRALPRRIFLRVIGPEWNKGSKLEARSLTDRMQFWSWYMLHWSMFLTGLASLSIFYTIGQDGWQVMAMPSDQPTHFMPCLMWSTYSIMDLKQHFLCFLLTHTPEDQSVQGGSP